MKKITITLSDKAEKYFNKVKYSLDDGDGKVVSNSRVINESLESLSDFEERFDMDLLAFMNEPSPPSLVLPTNEEIEKEFSTDLKTILDDCDYPVRFNAEQGKHIDNIRYNNSNRQEGAKWAISQIKETKL